MNIRDSIAFCVLGVSCAPMLAAANNDVHGVKNGSFLESEYWFRSHPCLVQSEEPTGGCSGVLTQDSRLISIGRSAVHCPESIERGLLPLLPIAPESDPACDPHRACDPEDPCVPPGERDSVLRIRIDHPASPSIGFKSDVNEIAHSVGNIFQTDIRLEPPQGCDPGAGTPVVLLRFDHFGLQPEGGTALETLVIAEKAAPNDPDWVGVDWGSGADLMPFAEDLDLAGETIAFYRGRVLGSPVYRCDRDGKEIDFWMPRQLPGLCDPEDDACDPSDQSVTIGLIGSALEGRVEIPPLGQEYFARWRTVETRIALDALPDWDCKGGFDQIERYRFTVAFRAPQERPYLGAPAGRCADCDDGGWETPSDEFKFAWRVPAYSEIDQVEMSVATLDGPLAECDFGPGNQGCGSANEAICRPFKAGPQIIAGDCRYVPKHPAVAVEWADVGQGSDQSESARVFESLEYPSDSIEENAEDVCKGCGQGQIESGVYRRRLVTEPYTPATPFAHPCPGDFNDDGVVNGADFGSLLAAWGSCSQCPEDLDCDGMVGGADLGQLLSFWSDCP